MASKNTTPEPQNAIDNFNDRLTDFSSKVSNHKTVVTIVIVSLVAIVLGILGYIYLVRKPAIKRANEAIGVADVQLMQGNDSLALVGYKNVIDNHGYKAKDRATIMAAGIEFQNGNNKEAIALLDGFDAPEELTEAAGLALKGDSYANDGNLSEALKCYEEAEKASEENPYYTPYFILKIARINHAMGNYSAEAEAYERVQNDYPNYASANQIDLDKFITRAKALAKK